MNFWCKLFFLYNICKKHHFKCAQCWNMFLFDYLTQGLFYWNVSIVFSNWTRLSCAWNLSSPASVWKEFLPRQCSLCCYLCFSLWVSMPNEIRNVSLVWGRWGIILNAQEDPLFYRKITGGLELRRSIWCLFQYSVFWASSLSQQKQISKYVESSRNRDL